MKKTMLTTCVEVANKDCTTAILLHQIAYWHPRMTVRKRDKLWIVKTREEWTTETGLSLDQYKKALAKLRGMCLVETAQMKWGSSLVSHLRLTDLGVRRLGLDKVREKEAVVSGGTTWVASFDTTQVGSGDTTLYTETTNTETTDTPSASVGAGGSKTDQGGSKMKQKGGYSVADVAKTPKKTPKLEDKVTAMELSWKEAVADVTGEFVPNLTQKARGQIKQIIKACPPGTAAKTMVRAVTHWHQFVEQCKEDTGKTKWSPSKPDLSFLVSNLQTAINFTPDEGWAAEGPSKPASTPAKKATTVGEW
jgi:hypothetical protein